MTEEMPPRSAEVSPSPMNVESSAAQWASAAQPAEPASAGWAPVLSGKRMTDLAKSGSFAVDEGTGDKMISALQGVIDSLQARWDALQRVGELPMMSQSAAGRWVAGHMVATASDSQGLLTQLRAARDEFPSYIEAIELAKKTYREREHTATESFRHLPGDPGPH